MLSQLCVAFLRRVVQLAHIFFISLNSPHGARVSGVVEETPGRLEYEVALYKEAPPLGRIGGPHGHSSHLPKNHSTSALQSPNNSEVPVDQAVPIGTKLQLRAKISTMSVWKYVKLMEVTVSPDPDDPHAIGSVSLVHDGCRNRDFSSIIPHQPARYRDRPNEVFLDFEAFLLSSMKERSTLWIHSQVRSDMQLRWHESICHFFEFFSNTDQSVHGCRRLSTRFLSRHLRIE